MVTKTQFPEPILPWLEAREDRLFKRLVVALIIVFMLISFYLNTITLPEVERKKLAEVAPRLAQLIVEKKKAPPPPPPPKKEIKKPEPKKEVKKPEEKPKPEPKKKPTAEERRAAAREKAQNSGLLAMQDDLADLRESFDFSDISDLPQQKAGKEALSTVSTSDFLTARATQGSGGIKTDTLNRRLTGSELVQRKTTQVKSNIESSSKIAANVNSKSNKSYNATRSQEEIERVFQKNKGSIFSIYNRELRKDPSLQGKVIVELTIDANGIVTKCIIVSSELKNKGLEKRLVSRIKKFKFTSRKVPVITVTYPIDFLPS